MIRRDDKRILGLFEGVRSLGSALDMLAMIEPCVYFLTEGERIVYVGKTTCLAKRLSDHSIGGRNTPQKVFDDVKYIIMPCFQSAARYEYALIKFIRPSLNNEFTKAGGGPGGSYLTTTYIPANKQFSESDAVLLSTIM